ncbi:MAG: AAA family ATPase [Candidatus Helarchaeota archaeon]|nr:AAA family ATPase [Candidatus Helarchaeota archaeon]
MKNRFLLGLIGIPSAGKTTFAKNLARKFKDDGYPTIIVGSDNIRAMIPGYSEKFDPVHEPIIRKITLNIIKDSLALGLNIINDDLNYYKSMRHNLFEIANTFNFHFLLVFIKVPLKKAIEWNEKRGLPIPNSVIENVYDKLDEPGEYSWDIPIITLETINLKDPEIINSAYSQIISKIEKPIKHKPPLTKSKPGKSESLDKLTRQLINETVSKEVHKKFNKQLSLMRKQFLIEVKREDYSLEEVKEKFSKKILDFIKVHQKEV